MALPIINTPTYELTIPSTKKKAKFRPFLVKEEKALLIAQQSEDETVMVDTLKSVIKSCTFDKVDVDKLALFDMEYMLCQIRGKSVGEISEMKYKCLNCNDPKGIVMIPIDLSKLEVEFNENHTADIQLSNDVGIKMKYPGLELLNKINNTEKTDTDIIFDTVIDSIDSIYSADEVFPAAEQKREDISNFIDNLTKEQFDKVENFFDTMPKLRKHIEWDCPNCGYHHKTEIEGLVSFF